MLNYTILFLSGDYLAGRPACFLERLPWFATSASLWVPDLRNGRHFWDGPLRSGSYGFFRCNKNIYDISAVIMGSSWYNHGTTHLRSLDWFGQFTGPPHYFMVKTMVSFFDFPFNQSNNLVGGLEHGLYFSIYWE